MMMQPWTLVVALATLSNAATYGAPANGPSYDLPPTPGEEAVQPITKEVTSLEAKHNEMLPHTEGSSSTLRFLSRRGRSVSVRHWDRECEENGTYATRNCECDANGSANTAPCETGPVLCSDLQLLSAAILGDVAAVERTMPAGVNVSVCGMTPLNLAMFAGHADVVRVLFSSMNNTNAYTREVDEIGRTPLHNIAYDGRVDIARLLVAAGANVSAEDIYGETPLHQAAKRHNREFVRFLLENGADVNATANNDSRTGLFTPLLLAAAGGHEEVVEELLSAGADVEAKASGGRTALMLAVRARSLNTLRALLSHGADVDARSAEGWTALHIAAKSSAPSGLVQILLEAGADAAATDKDGRTPLFYARTDDMRRALQSPPKD